jgi:hypothetical protein
MYNAKIELKLREFIPEELMPPEYKVVTGVSGPNFITALERATDRWVEDEPQVAREVIQHTCNHFFDTLNAVFNLASGKDLRLGMRFH